MQVCLDRERSDSPAMQEEVLRLARLQQAGQQAGQVQPEDAVALQRIGAAVVQNLLKEPVVQDLQKPLSKMKEAKKHAKVGKWLRNMRPACILQVHLSR